MLTGGQGVTQVKQRALVDVDTLQAAGPVVATTSLDGGDKATKQRKVSRQRGWCVEKARRAGTRRAEGARCSKAWYRWAEHAGRAAGTAAAGTAAATSHAAGRVPGGSGASYTTDELGGPECLVTGFAFDVAGVSVRSGNETAPKRTLILGLRRKARNGAWAVHSCAKGG